MKRTLFQIISLVLVICIISLCLSGCGKKAPAKVSLMKYKENRYSSNFTGDGVVCENEYLELLWDSNTYSVSFREKATGNVWGHTPKSAIDEGKGLTYSMKSALAVYYLDANYLGEKYIYSAMGAAEDGEIYTNTIENGLSVTYDFVYNKISVTVDYVLDGNSFSATVDPRKMSDDGKNYITAVSLMPFMCSVKNDGKTDWLFMPDGSGSVIYPKTVSQMGVDGEERIYGEDLSVRNYYFESVKEQINMPVFGVSKQSGGLFAVITSGAEQTSLCWSMGSSDIGYSSLYPKYRIRGYSLEKTPNNFGWTGLNYIPLFDESVVESPFKVEYKILSGDKNSLNGMADTYREYLTEKHSLTKSDAKEVSANYKFIGAVEQKAFVLGVPTTELFALTTTDDVKNIALEIKEKIGGNFSVSLEGFGKTGIDIGEVAGGFTVSSKLGSEKGLKKLAEYLKDNSITGSMDFDIISMGKSGAGYSYKNSAATLTNGPPASFYGYNSVSHGVRDVAYHILSRKLLPEAATKVINKKDMLSSLGVSFNSLSSIIYSDYGYNDFRNCKNMASDVKSILKAVKKQGFRVSAASANDYAACVADVLTDCPTNSSNYDFETYPVPFYEMIFRGYKPMSSKSVNLTSDEQIALLCCVESGVSPSYTVIANYENTLSDSDYSFIYGSVYESRTSRFTDGVNDIAEYLDSIKGAGISDYTVINSDVRVTKFTNGVWAVVNFGDSDCQSEYGTVPARG